MSDQPKTKRITLTTLRRMKSEGEKIAVLTAYDAPMARVAEAAGVEVVLVGDTLGMVIQGHDTTLPVTVDHVVYHTQAVMRGSQRALVIADMPFMSYAHTPQALDNAARLMREGGAQMIKLEGGATEAETVRALALHGIPVCAHLGLTPQSVHKLGGYRVQGREAHAAEAILHDALALQAAGADMMVLECVPVALAAEITRNLDIPVIGIGAGADTDGQVLVLQDVLGLTPNAPRFSENFMAPGRASIQEAIEAYVQGVKSGTFPDAAHSFS
ncbi:MAG: 3-methyl-2-oxobutanoate hydroxymethyltransferase [Gammaproteobacteria bacterium]|jgi:3-methyl-2-oxobutanoate hydroxymethyltransferase